VINNKNINNNLSKENLYIVLGLIFLILLNFSRLDSIRIKSIIFIIYFISVYLITRNKKIDISFSSNQSKFKTSGLLLILLIVLQNPYLNFETISIDVPSYLVASQNVGFSELPFEKQWESKGPLFIYMYKFLSYLSSKNLVLFKLLNDLLLYAIALLIFQISLLKSRNITASFFSTIFFICITSHVWYVTELSEIYCLVFIIYQYYLITKYELNNKIIFFSSLLISLSSLINQASGIFLLGLLFIVYRKKGIKESIKSYISIIFGFIIPHLFFVFIYLINNLLIVYFTNYIKIPFGYVGSGQFDLYELIVWLRRYFIYNEFLYYSIISIGIILLIKLFNNNLIENSYFINNIIYLLIGFSIYVIAGHSYQHHLFYSIAFLSILISLIEINKVTILTYSFIAISLIQIFSVSLMPAYNNLKSINSTFQNYPLNQLAKEIDSLFDDKDYDVLAVDHLLVLYYLDKPNTSYIIHPYNNFEEYIVDALIETKLLKSNENSHLSYYIEMEPDVIICTPQAIIDGYPTEVGSEFFNCEVTDYKKNYYQLDTEKYLNNPNREYFYDPYIEIDVFIKES
tara:strand:- start:4851 stop:6566 length:1716 start_codon:yes stop_codon:yes gene_type:complete